MSRRRWLAIGILLSVVAGGVWEYAIRRRPPQPPVVATADGADPLVAAAVATARQMVLKQPKTAAAWGELGMVFKSNGFSPEAAFCFTEAQRLDPEDPHWPYYLGVAAEAPENALPLLQRVIELKPKDPKARFCARMRLAETLLDLRRTDEAAAILKEEIAEESDNARVRYGLAQVALTLGDTKAAREHLTALADAPAARKRAAILLAAISREDGDLAVAGTFEDSVRRLPDDPDWPDPYMRDLQSRQVGLQSLLQQVQILENAGEYDQVLEIMEPLIRDNPPPRLLVSVGITLGKLGRYEQAEAMFSECLKRDPGNSQAQYFFAMMLFQRAVELGGGEKEKARGMLLRAAEAAGKAVELKPDHGRAWLYLGRSRLELGDMPGAIQSLRQAVACLPEFANPHLYLAEALAAAGQTAEAIVRAQAAVKLSPPDDKRAQQLLDRLTKE